MDGTLVDNMRFHAQAWVAISRKLGLSVPAERFEREFAGKKNEEIFPLLLGRLLAADELNRLADEKEALYRSLYAGHLEPLAGTVALLEQLAGAGLRLAVATAAPPLNRDFVLDGLRLRARFDRIIGAEDVTRGKPHPDIYLAAARALGVEPHACVAFEDAVNGILSAKAAGMFAVGVTTVAPEAALLDAGADWIVRDFLTLPLDLAALLFRPD
jgi:HAD superfamily hydrolase (TIGR01509 family)